MIDDTLMDVVADEEKPEEEEKELSICPRLLLDEEQTQKTLKLKKMIENIEFSITAEISTIEPEVTVEKKDQLLEVGSEREVAAKLLLTEEQKRDLKKAFNLLDYTGEGKIKADDFRVAIKALGYEPTKEELQNMINAVDKGQTGKLSFENFETAIMRKIMLVDSDGDIMKSFRLFDCDDTGLITFDNVKRVTKVLEIYLTDEEIEEMIEDADKDLDGEISVQEFMRMIKTSVRMVTP